MAALPPTASGADSGALHPGTYAGLFQAVTGLRNGRAILAMLACAVSGVLVAGAAMASSGVLGFLGPLLAALVWVVAIGTGVNAAGMLQMDAARGLSPRSLVDALVGGLMCIPKVIVLVLAVIAAEIVLFIALALVLFICKIPALGPLLYTVVFPLAVVIAGITLTALFLGVVLSVPAIWQGATIGRALAQTFAILKSRLVEVVLLLIVVGFLSFAVGLVVFGVLGAGLMPVVGMSASILGVGGLGGMGGGFGGMGMDGFGGGGGGYVIAGMIGGGLLWATALSLVAQVYLLGLCLVYLRVTDGLDLSAAESALRGKLDEARRRAQELSDRAKAAARPAETPAATPPAASPAATAAAAGFAGMAAAATHQPAPPPYQPPYQPPHQPSAPPAYVPPAPAPYVAPAPAAPATPIAPIPVDTADIDLPFDDAPAPSITPPAWTPPPAVPMPPPPAIPAAAANCPQCLSAVTPDDVFCGVCGYRLK